VLAPHRRARFGRPLAKTTVAVPRNCAQQVHHIHAACDTADRPVAPPDRGTQSPQLHHRGRMRRSIGADSSGSIDSQAIMQPQGQHYINAMDFWTCTTLNIRWTSPIDREIRSTRLRAQARSRRLGGSVSSGAASQAERTAGDRQSWRSGSRRIHARDWKSMRSLADAMSRKRPAGGFTTSIGRCVGRRHRRVVDKWAQQLRLFRTTTRRSPILGKLLLVTVRMHDDQSSMAKGYVGNAAMARQA